MPEGQERVRNSHACMQQVGHAYSLSRGFTEPGGWKILYCWLHLAPGVQSPRHLSALLHYCKRTGTLRQLGDPPIMDAQKPTPSSLEPLRRMAPNRCVNVKGSMPGGTFWKALSGHRAKKLATALLLTARGLQRR